MDIYVCKECGSDNVYWCRWVNANNEELKHNQTGTEGLVEWCDNCQDETTIIINSKYEKKWKKENH